MGQSGEENFCNFIRLTAADLGLYIRKGMNSDTRLLWFLSIYNFSCIVGIYLDLGQLICMIQEGKNGDIMQELHNTGCYVSIMIYANIMVIKRRTIVKLILQLDEDEYKKEEYKPVKTHVDRMSKSYYYAIRFGLIFWMLNRVVWNARCIAEKNKNLNGVLTCANSLSHWLPSQLDSPLLDWFILAFSSFALFYMPNLVTIINVHIGCTSVSVARLERLIRMLGDIDFTSGNIQLTKKEFARCIDFFNETNKFTDLIRSYVRVKLNPLNSYILMTIVALLVHGIITTSNFILFLELWVMMIGPTLISIHAQNLENMNEKLNIFLYELPWYQMHHSLIKDYELFFARTQKPFRISVPMNIDINMTYLHKVTKFAYTAFMFMSRMQK